MKNININTVSDECRVDDILSKDDWNKCITGVVKDSLNCCMAEVCVKVVTLAFEPIAHTFTDIGGNFTLIYEYIDNVQLIFSKYGYNTLVISDPMDSIHVNMQRNNLSCVLVGRIMVDRYMMSPVRLRLTNNFTQKCTFSNKYGNFVFTKVPSGLYQLIIEGNECKKRMIHIQIAKGVSRYNLGCIKVERINIMGTIHGIISGFNHKPLNNVVVILYDFNTCRPLAHTVTNEDGLYFFGKVRPGHYYVEAYN